MIDKAIEGGIKGIWSVISDWWRRKKGKADKVSNVFSDSLKVNDISREILFGSMLSVDCFLVMLAHNGGKRLKPLSLKYHSVVGGNVNKMLMPNFDKENYVNLPVDYEYEALLNRILQAGTEGITIHTSEVTGYLRTKYEFERLNCVRYYFLHCSTEGEFYYLMVGTTQPGEEMNDTRHKHKLFIALNKIKAIIKRH